MDFGSIECFLDHLHPGVLRCRRCGCGSAGGRGGCRQGRGGLGRGGLEQCKLGLGELGQCRLGRVGELARCRQAGGGQGRCRQAGHGGGGQSSPEGWSKLRKTTGWPGTLRSGRGPAMIKIMFV